MKYHHLGIPNNTKREGEYYLEKFKMHVLSYDTNPYGIEWLRFEDGCPLPELVQKVPHLAFEVDDLDKAIEGKKIIIEPNSPTDGVRVAFIEHDGLPVEFLEYSENEVRTD